MMTIKNKMNIKQSDKELLDAIVGRDIHAFEKLYQRYRKSLFGYILRFVKQRDAVEEVVNDVMLVVWEKASMFAGRSAVSSWIFGIAYHKSIRRSEINDRHNYVQYFEEDEEEYTDYRPEVDPELSYKQQEFIKRLSKGLTKLSDDHRDVVKLSALGHSYSDIASIIRCPENTVKTRVFHARKRLKGFKSLELVH